MIRLFSVSIPTSILVLVILDATLLFGCYFLVGLLTLFDPETYLNYENGWWQIVLAVVVVQMGLYFTDCYEDLNIHRRFMLLQKLSLVIGSAFLIQALLGYARSNFLLPRSMMLFGSLIIAVIYPAWRRGYSMLLHKVSPVEKVLFLGKTAVTEYVAQLLTQKPEFGMQAVGYLEASREGAAQSQKAVAEEPGQLACLGTVSELNRVMEQVQPRRVIVVQPEVVPKQQLLQLQLSPLSRIEPLSTLYEAVFSRVSLETLNPMEQVLPGGVGWLKFYMSLQRVYMSLMAVIGIVVFSPVIAVVALLVKVSSPGPILFRQTRVGWNESTFSLYKFRSMYEDAEARTGAVWATKDDPRITPIGKWLRLLRLDELPQLFNVIKGEMSLVGPRPERPEFTKILEEKIPAFGQRLSVRPGITGWAQINHKYGDTIEDMKIKLEYDLYYIKNLSPALDFYIIFHTVKVMLLARGAQ